MTQQASQSLGIALAVAAVFVVALNHAHERSSSAARRRLWNGATVRRLRAHWAYQIAAHAADGMPLHCYRCGNPVLPEHAFDVDHMHELDAGGALDVTNTHPSHTACNRRHGAQLTNGKRRARTDRTRSWLS